MTQSILLASRNKREGWYAGWRPLLATEGYRRSGKPLQGIDWIPYPHPLNKRLVERFEGPVDVRFFEGGVEVDYEP